MKLFYSMMLFLTLGMCLGMVAPAHGYNDLARDATVVATDYNPDYGKTYINNGAVQQANYYWSSGAGFEENTMSVELDWAGAQKFDTVMVHLFNHPIAYEYYNGGSYGTTRVYHLQQETSPGVWGDIATGSAVSDPDDATPFVQFNLSGGVDLSKVRVQNIFDMEEIAVWNRTTNIAASATVTASFVDERPEYAPSKVADNDFSTMYFPGIDNVLNTSNTGWLQFEWTGLQEINSFRAYFFAHPDLIEGRVVNLQEETSPGVWTTIMSATVGREDSGYYQCADFALPAGSTYGKLRLENTFDVFEVDINGSAVPEPSTLALLTMSLIGLIAYAWRKRK